MLWIHLDDVEVHYCKVLLDEIFARQNFVAHITYERSAVAGLGQGGYLVNTTEHILLYKKGALPGKTNLSFEELGFNIIKRYNRYVSNFGERTLVREFTAKSNGEVVRVYEHSGVEIESISLRDVKNREAEIRQEFVVHLDSLFRGNRVQKENEFQNDIIASLDKGKFYSVDYIPSRGKNKDELTTLYYYNCELLSWLKDTTTLESGMLMKTQKMTTLWKHGEIPKADIANEGGVYFPRSKKPEQLLRRIIEMSTEPGDIVLDTTPYQYFTKHLHRYNEWVQNNPDKAKAEGLEELPIIPLHGLRHSCATLLNYLEVNIIEISKTLGHSTCSTTMNIYAHSFEEQQEEVATKVNEFLRLNA